MIIIFGSSGFIGKNLRNFLKSKKIKYLGISLSKRSDSEIILNKINKKEFVKIFKKYKPQSVINLHAHTNISNSIKDFDYDYAHNVEPVIAILSAINEVQNKPFFFHTGTATQVGYTNIKKSTDTNITEEPETIFDLNKSYSEKFINIYKKEFNIKATTFRLTNIFGPGSHRNGSGRGIINKMIQIALDKKKIDIYGDGKFVRDFLYIDDLCEAFYLAHKFRNKLNKNYYYLSSDVGTSFNDFSKILRKNIFKKYRERLIINYKKWPKNTPLIDKRSFVGNSKDFRRITHWSIKDNLNDNILKTLNYFEE